jgi:hypothetical protein
MVITAGEAIVRYMTYVQLSLGELRCAISVRLLFVLSAVRHCVRRHVGHVMERPCLGFPFARSAAAEANYSCAQIGRTTLRRHPTTGAVQRGKPVTRFVAGASHNRRVDSGRSILEVTGSGVISSRVARGSTLSKGSLRSAFRLVHHPFKAADPRALCKRREIAGWE